MLSLFNAFFSVYLAWVFMSINIPEGMTKNIPLASAGGTMGTGIALWQAWLWWSLPTV